MAEENENEESKKKAEETARAFESAVNYLPEYTYYEPPAWLEEWAAVPSWDVRGRVATIMGTTALPKEPPPGYYDQPAWRALEPEPGSPPPGYYDQPAWRAREPEPAGPPDEKYTGTIAPYHDRGKELLYEHASPFSEEDMYEIAKAGAAYKMMTYLLEKSPKAGKAGVSVGSKLLGVIGLILTTPTPAGLSPEEEEALLKAGYLNFTPPPTGPRASQRTKPSYGGNTSNPGSNPGPAKAPGNPGNPGVNPLGAMTPGESLGWLGESGGSGNVEFSGGMTKTVPAAEIIKYLGGGGTAATSDFFQRIKNVTIKTDDRLDEGRLKVLLESLMESEAATLA
jgi:hypothetical protein